MLSHMKVVREEKKVGVYIITIGHILFHKWPKDIQIEVSAAAGSLIGCWASDTNIIHLNTDVCHILY